MLALSAGCADESLERLVPGLSLCPTEDALLADCDRGVAFGEIPVTVPTEVELFVKSTGTSALRVQGADTADGWLSIAQLPDVVPRGLTGLVRLQVLLQPDQLGPQSTTLTVESDDPARRSFSVSIELTGIPKPAPDIVLCEGDDCDIDVVDFGSVRRTRTVGREIVVQNIGNLELAVSDVFIRGSSSFPGEFSLLSSTQDAVLQPGQAAAVVVAYGPADNGSDTVEFVVASDDPDTPEAVVQLVGASPENLPPIAVAIDEVSAQTQLSARVEDLLSVDGVGSSDPEGDPLVWRWTLTVPAGSSAALDDASAARARFVPDRTGAYRASLIVVDSLGQESVASDVLYDVRPRFGFRATLAWAGAQDLDLHLVGGAAPGASTSLFGPDDCGGEVRAVDFGQAALAVDDCVLFDDAPGGPAQEVIVIESVAAGTYGIWVHVFDDFGVRNAAAEVTLQVDDGAPILVQTQTLPGRCSAWHVADITFPGGFLSSTTDPLAEVCR